MKYYSLDTETFDPYLTDKGPSWVWGEGEVIVTGLYNCQTKKAGYIDGSGGKKVKDILLDKNSTIIGANIAYDLGWLCNEHSLAVAETKCGLIDVQVAESLIDSYARFDLDSLADRYLGERKGYNRLPALCTERGLKGDFRKHLKTLWDAGFKKEIRAYVVSDADQPARIWEKQKKIMEAEGFLPAFDVNMRMLKVCAKMKQRGVRINKEQWDANCKLAADIHEKLETQFFAKYGKVNVRSAKQLGEFFDRNKVPYKYRVTIRGWEPEPVDMCVEDEDIKITGKIPGKFVVSRDAFTPEQVQDQRKRLREDFPTLRVEKDKLRLYVDQVYLKRTLDQLASAGYNAISSPNCDKYFLKDNAASYEVVADLLEYKQVGNIITKFLGPNFGKFLSYHKDTDEWRLHGDFLVVGARQTGRLSCKNPNLQNIGNRTILFKGTEHEVDLAVMCREVFLPEKGELWVKLDFSGQENRLQAHFAVGSSGTRIRKMYNERPRFDEHQFVASASGLEEEHGHKIGRIYAKGIRFGLSYGMMIGAMMRMYGWTKEFCQDLIDRVKDASPWFVETMEAVQEKVKRVGFIKTLLGRKIRLRGWENMTRSERAVAKVYQFYNYLIQGSAADQTKAAQVNINETETVDIQLLTVHDEGDHSLPMTDEGRERLIDMVNFMQTSVKLGVPMICDPAIGSDWAHLEEQKRWTEQDFKDGLCKKEQVGEYAETFKQFWKRMCKAVKNGEKVRVHEFDLSDLDDEETEEEDV